MRLLGHLHRGSQGGAEVEQVGEAAGKTSGGPSPRYQASPGREGLPQCPGLCSARYLDSF